MNDAPQTNDTSDFGEWTCSMSRSKTQHGYLLAGFLILVGLVFIFIFPDASPDARIIGGVTVVFGCFIFAMAHRTMAKSQRLLVLNNKGIWYQDWKGPVVPWGQISDLDIAGSRIKAELRIAVKDIDAIAGLLDESARKAFIKNPLEKGPILSIPNGNLNVPLDEVSDRILAHTKRANA